MKKNLMKKTAALIMSILLMGAMSVTAFAADFDNGVYQGGDLSVNITKVLKVKNPDLSKVDGPGASYTYTVAPQTPSADNGGLTVTDSENRTASVHAGPQGGVTLEVSEIKFPVGSFVNASPQGADNKKSIKATSDISKFTAPGIYRYVISETPSLGTCGVTDTGDRERYLDVYVVNGTDGLEISGFTLHDKYNNKTDGFNGGTSGSGQDFSGAALFETVNITLTKDVQGNMGDKRNQFPFTGSIDDSGRAFYAKKGAAPSATDDNLVRPVKSATGVSTTLCDDEKYYISGLSKTAAVAYTETNNTEDVYQTSVTGGTPKAATAVSPEGTVSMESTNVMQAADVTFINTLQAVSPTGVVMRYGAPLSMLLLGAALAVLTRRSKKGSLA